MLDNYIINGKIAFFSFCFIIAIVSFLYSSIGHGGASSYLAIMALFGDLPEKMRITALILNLLVAGLSFFHFYKRGYFNSKLFIPFAIGSIPMAFVGGLFMIDADIYKKLLALFLVFAILKLLGVIGRQNDDNIRKPSFLLAVIIGAVIGFFSGLIGIGGGIILTPVILLLYWGKAKEVAATSALFIWVNSLAGLIGQISIGVTPDMSIIFVLFFALIGGFLGGYMGSSLLSQKSLKYLMTSVLVLASIKLLV